MTLFVHLFSSLHDFTTPMTISFPLWGPPMGWREASGKDCRRADCAAGWRGIPSCLAAWPDTNRCQLCGKTGPLLCAIPAVSLLIVISQALLLELIQPHLGALHLVKKTDSSYFDFDRRHCAIRFVSTAGAPVVIAVYPSSHPLTHSRKH